MQREISSRVVLEFKTLLLLVENWKSDMSGAWCSLVFNDLKYSQSSLKFEPPCYFAI